MGSASEVALAGPGVEPAAPQDTAPAPEAQNDVASPDSGPGDAQPETTAWREELAERISHYRSRRKPLPPRFDYGVLGKYAKLVGSAAIGAVCS